MGGWVHYSQKFDSRNKVEFDYPGKYVFPKYNPNFDDGFWASRSPRGTRFESIDMKNSEHLNASMSINQFPSTFNPDNGDWGLI